MSRGSSSLRQRFERWRPKYSTLFQWGGKWIDGRRNLERALGALERRGIRTPADLVVALPRLRGRLLDRSFELIGRLQIRRAAPLLRSWLDDPRRAWWAEMTLAELRDARTRDRWLAEARAELEHADEQRGPSAEWSAVARLVEHSCWFDDAQTSELVVQVFEHRDLPGWLRGEAGDKVGKLSSVNDRRTGHHRRTLSAALRGVAEEDLEVRFWSIYVIAELADHASDRPRARRTSGARAALPMLRRIAREDSRPSPGFWWPVSAEAEDAIHCIEHGSWPATDAGDRWPTTGPRGPLTRPCFVT